MAKPMEVGMVHGRRRIARAGLRWGSPVAHQRTETVRFCPSFFRESLSLRRLLPCRTTSNGTVDRADDGSVGRCALTIGISFRKVVHSHRHVALPSDI